MFGLRAKLATRAWLCGQSRSPCWWPASARGSVPLGGGLRPGYRYRCAHSIDRSNFLLPRPPECAGWGVYVVSLLESFDVVWDCEVV